VLAEVSFDPPIDDAGQDSTEKESNKSEETAVSSSEIEPVREILKEGVEVADNDVTPAPVIKTTKPAARKRQRTRPQRPTTPSGRENRYITSDFDDVIFSFEE
jgi:hypothetical protein